MTTLDFEDILNISFIIDKKNIRYLTHYTNIANIENILKYGLMPISLLHKNNIKFYKNDPDRADYTDAICLNIEFPNYKLFYKNRVNSNTDWAVIILNAENILCSLDVAFCRTNAANYYMSSIPIEQRKTLYSFLDMFYDNEEHNLRSTLGIPDNYPTDPQAEILVFEKIDISNIIEIQLDKQILVDKYKKLFPNLNFIFSDNLLKARKDYKYWSPHII